jgi:periplasmic protein TonB
MTSRLIGVLLGLLWVAQCSTKEVDTQRAQAARAEEVAFDAAVPVPDGVYRVRDTGVSPPTLVRSAYAAYTPEAFRAKVRGSVILRAIVDPNGAVADVRILRPLEASLDVAASKALAQWKFRPGTRDGEPVTVAVVVRMAFTTP